ncbi:MAG: outer rane lipoprotein carrier protein LolA [Acidobacteriales bacterium]|nr:outer rane lipoprotein carrier protein LolA [Terriglobales bacterium]
MNCCSLFTHPINMQRFSFKIVVALFVVCLTTMALGADDRAAKIASQVDKRYNSLQSFKADFVELYSGTGVNRQESGTLTLKRPGRMRWDYREPTEKLFLSDGKTAFFYVPGERQARKTDVKKIDDLRSPLRYLLGKTKLQKEFDGLAIVEGVRPKKDGNVVIGGVPKNMADRVSRVLFEISPANQIERIVIEEVDGATTEFQFNNIVENVNIPDQQFHFNAPSGVELIEGAGLGSEWSNRRLASNCAPGASYICAHTYVPLQCKSSRCIYIGVVNSRFGARAPVL